jgi:hypothetical protein
MFGLMKNDNNPHILGLLAQEIFFIEDHVILVEGQEDVVFFKRVQADIGPLSGHFFGWGVGGAENMGRIATVLDELGFARVVGVLDGNRTNLAETLSKKFPTFHFFAIPADDIRTKSESGVRPAVVGLLDEANDKVRAEFAAKTKELFEEANRYLTMKGRYA